jgi:hypothetical protein
MTLSVQILLSLLTLFAGMLLLAKTKKDSLGRFFSFISWFIIVISLGLFISYMSRGMYGCYKANKCGSSSKYCKDKPCMPGNCYMMCCEHNKMGMCCKEKQKMCCEQNKDKMLGGPNGMEAMSPDQRAENIVVMLKEKLKLTTDQVPKVKEIFLKSIQAIDQQMKDAGDDMGKCGKQCEKIKNDKLDALKKVLTPEQFKNLPDWCSKSCMGK